MPNKTNKQNNKRDTLTTLVREELVYGGSGGPGTSTVNAIITAGQTSSSYNFVLSPLGLVCATLVSGVFSNVASSFADFPHLRKLYNLASDFRYYRVTSGKLIFTPNVGSAQIGQVVLASSRDPSDSFTSAQIAYSSGPNYKTFNLSSTNKETSVPLDIDSSWKKVSAYLTVPASTSAMHGNVNNTGLVPVSTVADLSFSCVSINVINPVASAFDVNYGVVTIEYTVELKGIIDSAVNF